MRTALWAAAVAALLVAGCSGGFSDRAQQARGSEVVFRYPIVTNPTTLDPGMVQDGDTIDLLQQIYEGLVTWGEDNRVHPQIAEKWEIEDEGRTYVFTLKRGVKFHNGREVTAEDFKWTLERNTNPKFASPTTQYLADVVGVNARVESRADPAPEIRGVEVRDSHTLVIRIDKARPYFLGKLTYIISAVLPKESVPQDREMSKPEEVVGTGPFRLKQYSPDQLIVLEAFADYHGGAPKLARIERPVIKDPATRLNKFKAGEVDLTPLERQDLPALRADTVFAGQIQAFDRPAIWYIGLNQDAYPAFKKRDVRRAVAMAIDRDSLVDEILGGVNAVARSIVPPGVLGHRDNAAAIPFSPEEARRLLAEAGHPGGRGLPPLELTFREGRPDIRIVAEAVAGQLEQNLGLKVSLRTMEWRAYLEKWNRREIGFFHMRWAADYLDPENFLSFMLSTTGPENKIGYSNAEFDRLCAEADGMMDEARRLEFYAQAEDIVLQDAPWIPIYFQRDFELISPKVSGLRKSLFGHLPHVTTTVSRENAKKP